MSEFVEVKTSELSGEALNWAVAKVEGLNIHCVMHGGFVVDCEEYLPSTDWSRAGPLIDKYRLDLEWISSSSCRASQSPYAPGGFGRTYLVAACRAIVASVLGHTVSVPKELM